MKLIYLDVDGVLNTHNKFENGYCGVDLDKSLIFNRLLDNTDAMVVFSSAWRYLVHNRWMTEMGLEYLFLTKGLNIQDRVYGVTAPDPDVCTDNFQASDWAFYGLIWRQNQIIDHISRIRPERHVIIDDLPLKTMTNFVKIDTKIGITHADVDQCLQFLEG